MWIFILLDVIGMASLFFPVVGEVTDLVWGPLSAVLLFVMFKRQKLIGLSFVELVEEVLPLTDILPTFTIAWFVNNNRVKKQDKKG